MSYEERNTGGSSSGSGDDQGGGRMSFKKKFVFRKKFCRFCKDENETVDYKDPEKLRKFTKNGGKILPRRFSGNCARHQRMVAKEIKKARAIAFLPYVSE